MPIPCPNNPDGYGVNSFLNGQFFAEVYGIGMAYSGAFMNTWSIFESNGSENSTDLSFLDGTAMTPRSSYYHMQMVAKNFSGTYAAGTSNLPNVRAYGCKDTGKICAIILNMENSSQRAYTVQLNTAAISSPAAAKINIDAGCNASYSDTIGNQSTQLLVFTSDGQLAKKYSYSLTMYSAKQAPAIKSFAVGNLPGYRRGGNVSQQAVNVSMQGNFVFVKMPQARSYAVSLLSVDGKVQQLVRGFGEECRIYAGRMGTGVRIVNISWGDGSVERVPMTVR